MTEEFENQLETNSNGETEVPSGESAPETPRKSIIGRIFAWLLGGVGTIFGILILLTLVLYIPAVQTYIVNTTLSKLETTLGMRIHAGSVRVGFPVKIHIGDVVGLGAKGDTLAVVGRLTASISILPILQGKDYPVSGIELSGTSLDYAFPNDSLFLKGTIGEVKGDFFSYEVSNQIINLSNISIKDGDVSVVVLTDTVPKPDDGEKSRLVIYLDEAKIENLRGRFSLSLDTLIVDAYISDASLRNGEINIDKQYYRADHLDLKGELFKVGPSIDFLPLPWRVEVDGDNPRYGGSGDIHGRINHLVYELGDGWAVRKASFTVDKDSVRGVVKDLDIELNESRLRGKADLPFDEWIPADKGHASFDLTGNILLKELERFIGSTEAYPSEPIDLALKGNGDIDGSLLVFGTVRHENLIDLTVDGNIFTLFNNDTRNVLATYDLETKAGTMDALKKFLDTQAGKPGKYSWRVPGGMSLKGKGEYSKDRVYADFLLDAVRGSLGGRGEFGLKTKAYSANLDFRNLDLEQFLPGDTLGIISGTLSAHGSGTDFFAKSTRSDFLLEFDSLLYKDQTFRDVKLEGALKENHLFASVDADHEALKMNTLVNALLIKGNTDISVNMQVDTIIPSMLGIKNDLLRGARFELMSDLHTDFKEHYSLTGRVENFLLQTDKALISPSNTYITAETNTEKVDAEIKSGDLRLNLSAQNGLKDFTNRLGKVAEVVSSSLKDSIAEKIDMASWMTYYPTMQLSFEMGRDNALRSYLDQHRIGAQSARISLSSVTGEGLKGEGFVKMFQKDTLRIDGLDLVINQDSSFFYAVASAHKERFRNQAPFDILASITSNVRRSEANVSWIDDKGADYMRFGLGIWNSPNGDIKIDFTPEPIVLAYNTLTVEGENYILLPKENRMHIRANMRLSSRGGGELYLHDEPSPDGHLLKADIRDLKLAGLEGIQFLPQFAGSLSADAEWLQNTDGSLYTINGSTKDFVFEKKEIGDLQLSGLARQSKTGLQAEADVTMGGIDVALVKYFQSSAKGAKPLLALTLDRFPLEKANPFLPNEVFTLAGLASGEVTNFDEAILSGDLSKARSKPMLGYVQISNGDVFVPMLNETYRMDSKRIEIRDGVVFLKDFGFSANGQRLTTDGTVGLSGRYPLNLAIKARNMTILDSKPSKEAMIYGLVNANVDLAARGPADALHLSGNIGLLGSTKATYVTQNSKLENKNGYRDLVRFTDFSDTLFVANKRINTDSLTFGGANLDFAIHIDPAAELTALLAADGSNWVQVKGGGDLHFTMPPYGAMQLTGMYKIGSGNVNLKLDPISKRFEIDDGSSLVWTGELLKPEIRFRATTRVNSRVSTSGKDSRTVAFDVSIIAENTLDNLKIRFEAKAPEDLAVTNQLLAMNEQEQTRQAMMLLTTSQYIGSGGNAFALGRSSSGVLGNVLTSFLSSQINSFAGDALDAQIDFGINDATTAEGTGTNYSYSIAKSFLNDRIHVVVGGKVMTGAAAYGMEQTFIDNMSLEYQLDEAGTHYLRLFHNKNFENLLDGEVIETGLGYVMRRRFNTLRELFDLRGLKADPIRLPVKETPKDSVPTTPSSK